MPDNKSYENIVVNVLDNTTQKVIANKAVVVANETSAGNGLTGTDGNAVIELLPLSAKIKYSITGGLIYAPENPVVGEDYTLTYEPLTGNVLKSITVDGVELENLSDYQTSYTFYKVNSDHEIEIVFGPAEETNEVVSGDTTNTAETPEGTLSSGESMTTEGTSTAVNDSTSSTPKTGDTSNFAGLLLGMTAALCASVGVTSIRKGLKKRNQ